MKSQTLAVSVVLLLIAVATLPGLSFSLSSSVTSYNNGVIINGGIKITSGDFFTENVKVDDFDEAYEIASSENGFDGGRYGKTVELKISNERSFYINVKFENYNPFSFSGFYITIKCGNTTLVDNANLRGGSLDTQADGSRQGYLCETGGWHLVELFSDNAKEFKTNGDDDFTITVLGNNIPSVKIHLYIVFIDQNKAG